jgi:hypothetical protein
MTGCNDVPRVRLAAMGDPAAASRWRWAAGSGGYGLAGAAPLAVGGGGLVVVAARLVW